MPMALACIGRYQISMIKSCVDGLYIGQPKIFRDDGATSTIGGRLPVQSPVPLTYLGFAGDQVADPAVHGGVDKAVHFYPAEHYAPWRADRAKAGLPPHPLLSQGGGFGENISGLGLTEDVVFIGDRFRIGTAVLEISQGRQPCWKIDHNFGQKGMTAAVIRTGRSGYYFRVIEQGVVAPGDAIQQVEQMTHCWTVERTFQLLITGLHKAPGASATFDASAALTELASLDVLAQNWRERAMKLLGSV
jgi:MOSC domain-containing protein YiiM